MLAAPHLKQSWIYRKIQVLAIFDDLDTILLMIPLQILMIGLKWQMFAIVGTVSVLLAVGWRWQAAWNVKQDWKRILGLSVAVCALTQLLYLATAHWYGPENSIHIEVLLPAFVIGMLMKHRDHDTPAERRASTGISFLFMLLVGMSMPLVTGSAASDAAAAAGSVTAAQPMNCRMHSAAARHTKNSSASLIRVQALAKSAFSGASGTSHDPSSRCARTRCTLS